MNKKTFTAALTLKELKKTLLAPVLVILILVLSPATVQAFEVTDAITLELYGGYYGVAYDSGRGEIYLTNGDFELVYVISDSTNTVVATIPVGRTPSGIAYNAAKGELFVTNFRSDTVSVISDNNHTIVATIPVGNQPCALAYDEGNSQIYVANYDSNSISVISDNNHTVVATIPLESQPQAIGYDYGKEKIFVAYSESYRVTVISVPPRPSPSPSIPESPSPSPSISESPSPSIPDDSLFIAVSFLVVTIFLIAILYRRKYQTKNSR